MDFQSALINWYNEHKRDLPWRRTKDPYKVWLSEIILQQTRVAQGLPYYIEFVKKYPNVYALAQADEQEILKLWQGLGYYSRARNLHIAAQTVVQKYDGIFPTSYQELKKLKGIGDYTASAIVSICFDEPQAVLDGNVFRVLSRIYGMDVPINSTEGKKIFKEKALGLVDKTDPGTYNQAIMEFGATHCKPKLPLCESCPFQTDCVAFQQGKIESLPVKLKTIKIKKRYFNYFYVRLKTEQTFLKQRVQKDIWRNLYEFPILETKQKLKKRELLATDLWKRLEAAAAKWSVSKISSVNHQLTHQKLHIDFWEVTPLNANLEELSAILNAELVDVSQIEKFPVPVVIEKFINDIR